MEHDSRRGLGVRVYFFQIHIPRTRSGCFWSQSSFFSKVDLSYRIKVDLNALPTNGC